MTREGFEEARPVVSELNRQNEWLNRFELGDVEIKIIAPELKSLPSGAASLNPGFGMRYDEDDFKKVYEAAKQCVINRIAKLEKELSKIK